MASRDRDIEHSDWRQEPIKCFWSKLVFTHQPPEKSKVLAPSR